MVEAGRAARPGCDPLAGGLVHLPDVGGAAGVEPGIVRRDVPPVAAHPDDSGHLPVDADPRDVAAAEPGLDHAFLNCRADGGELALGVFFDRAGGRAVKPGGLEGLGQAPAGLVEQHGLGALSADVDAQ